MTGLEKKIENLLKETIEQLGYDFYDVIYVKEGKDYYLKILIDNEKGISLDDCEKVSNIVSDMLDTADYIKEQYFLEVSSAGIERVLRKDKHFEDNLGKEIEVKLYKTIDKNKIIIGTLKKYNEKSIEIQIENEIIKIERNNIAIAKIRYKW